VSKVSFKQDIKNISFEIIQRDQLLETVSKVSFKQDIKNYFIRNHPTRPKKRKPFFIPSHDAKM